MLSFPIESSSHRPYTLPPSREEVFAMKKGIHPEYKEVTVKCGCGNTFTTRSTKGGTIAVEICSNCHPFYTGKQKFVDTAGMVERFQKKWTGDMAKQARELAEGKKPGAKSAAATRS